MDPFNYKHNILGVIERHAAELADKRCINWIESDGSVKTSFTFQQIWQRSGQIAAHLISQHKLASQETVLLVFPPGIDFILAFLGVQRAGGVPVLVPPPNPAQLDKDLSHFNKLAQLSKSRLSLTLRSYSAALNLASGWRSLKSALSLYKPSERWTDLAWINIDSLGAPSAAQTPPSLPRVQMHHLAFIQYTSGSTGDPKGVEVTHRNLTANLQLICQTVPYTRDTVGVTWLPHFHDFCLIGCVLSGFHAGNTLYLQSPLDFVRDPNVWLRAMSRYRATHTAVPTFALDLSARKYDGSPLDLSKLRCVVLGAEPVRKASLERFAHRFAPSGFSLSAYKPAYGMAEATLGLSFYPTVPKSIADLLGPGDAVLCGPPCVGVTMRIVDPNTGVDVTDAGQEGEIWVSSPSVSNAYHNLPRASADTFHNYLNAFPGQRFLRTGDLGKFCTTASSVSDQRSVALPQIIITGRLKDVFIIHGRNVYPQDIEEALWTEWPDVFKAGSVAVFANAATNQASTSTLSSEPNVVLCAEVRKAILSQPDRLQTLGNVLQLISSRVLSTSGIMLDHIVLTEPGQIPRTTSGKIRRKQTTALYQQGSIKIVLEDCNPRSAWIKTVVDVIADIPNAPADLIQTLEDLASSSLTQIGCDSLMLFTIASRLSQVFQVDIHPSQLVDAQSLENVANLVADARGSKRQRDDIFAGEALETYEPTADQKRIFLESAQSSQRSLAYHISHSLDLAFDDQVDLEGLRRAIHAVVGSNDSLRSVFAVDAKGEPVARVLPPPQLSSRFFRLLLQPEDEDDTEETLRQTADSFLSRWTRASLDISKSSFEAVLIPISDRRVVLAFKVHHIVFDGFSAVLLAQRISAAYTARSGSQTASNPLPQFSLLATAQQIEQGQEMSGRVPSDAFWQSVHHHAPNSFERKHRLRHADASVEDGQLITNLSRETRLGVQDLSRKLGCSAFAFYLTAFMQLLSDFEMADDFLVACPLTKRTTISTRSMIGFLVNTMLVRSGKSETADKNSGKVSALEHVSRQVQAYLKNPAFDFEAVLQRIQHGQSQQSPSVAAVPAALLSLWFNMHEFALEAEMQTYQLSVVDSRPLWNGVAKFPLGLELLAQANGSLDCVWEYSGSIYTKSEVDLLAQAFTAMVDSAVQYGLNAADNGGSQTDNPFAWEASPSVGEPLEPSAAQMTNLVEMFKASAVQYADRVAIEDAIDGHSLSYREVDQHTDQLASLIRARLDSTMPSRSAPHVALALERGPHLAMSIIAVLKAGAAYVPLDLSNPAERNRFIIDQVASQLVLVDHATEPRFAKELSIPCLNVQSGRVAAEPALQNTSLPQKIDPASTCYVLFTSGSTGAPKGCVMTHQAVSASIKGHLQATSCPKGIRTLQFARYTFDHSVLELFMTICCGGTLVTAPQSELMANLSGLVSEFMISMCVLTPTVASLLCDPQDLPWLRLLILSGEPTAQDIRNKWLAPDVKTKLFNLYGTTEGGIHQFYCRMTADQLVSCVGTPLPSMEALVLDSDLEPLPKGAVGQIWVSGPYLGEGYLANVDATSRHFKSFPRQGLNQPILAHYTGDLGFFDQDGALQLVGRQDHLVKVRGQRVELGEIEAQISEFQTTHRLSSKVAVILRFIPNLNEQVLVAFVESGKSCDRSDVACPSSMPQLEDFLYRKLPRYMVPTFFVSMERISLTSSGKLDRKSLATLAWEHKHVRALTAASTSSTSLPSSIDSNEPYQTVDTLVETIRSVTGLDCSVDTNLIESGITSITAMRILAVLRSHHKMDASVNDFFDHTTIAQIAASIDRRQGGKQSPSMSRSFVSAEMPNTPTVGSSALSQEDDVSEAAGTTPLDIAHFQKHPLQRHESFPLTALQQSYLIGRRSDVDLSLSSKTMVEIVLPGDFSVGKIKRAFEILIKRHDALRLVFDSDAMEQRVLQYDQVADRVPVSFHDLSSAELSPAESLSLLTSFKDDVEAMDFDPACWPLFDVRLARFSPVTPDDGDSLHLWLSLDLLIIDAKSVQTLFFELQGLLTYALGADDIGTHLIDQETGVTFRDYVLWHKNCAFDEATHVQAEKYWKGRLPTLPLAPSLPLRTTGSSDSSSASVHHLQHTFDEDLWPNFVAKCTQHSLLPSAALMTTFVDTLRLWSQEPYFTVNTTLFNRQYVDENIDAVIGDFTEGFLFQTPDELDSLDGSSTATKSFAARAKLMQRQLLCDISHSHYSSIEVIRDLQRHRPGCLMPVVFTCILPSGQGPTPSSEAQTSSPLIDFKVASRKTQTSQVMLDFQIFPSLDGKNIEVHLDYMDVFEPGVAQEVFNAFASALASSVRSSQDHQIPNWEKRPSFAQLLSEHLEPRNRANKTSNGAICKEVLGLPDQSSMLTDAFLQIAQRSPHKIAVESIDGCVTYGQLASRAARGANLIRQALNDGGCLAPSAEPQNVAVLMDKSSSQIASVLAVLLSGNAYVPIDVEAPSERVAAIAQGADIRLVMASKVTGTDKLASFEHALFVEEMGADAGSDLDLSQLPLVRRSGDQLAYTIFTSGSTGKPKGVRISHHGALNTIASVIDRFELNAEDACLGLSKLSFDLSVYDIFGTLSLGAKLVLPHPDQLKDPGHWIEVINGHGVTVWNSVPMLLQMLVAYQPADDTYEDALSKLRVVLLSGDRIPVELLRNLLRREKQSTKFYALGGATEASIWSNYHAISASDVSTACSRPIPYGVPLDNQQMFIYKAGPFSEFNHAPDFVIGDLYIGGDGLAQGYMEGAQTQKAFTHHPESGLRLYRTGDVARYLPNGLIEFVGRNDLLVKVGGNRVELQEISTVGSSMYGIQGMFVDVHRNHLVGFVVPSDDERNKVSQLEGIPLLVDETDRKLHKMKNKDRRSLPTLADARPPVNTTTIAGPTSHQTRITLDRKSTYIFSPEAVPLTTLQDFITGSLAPSVNADGCADFGRAVESLLSILAPVQKDGARKHRYPSAGATYSVNVLLSVSGCSGIGSGVYAVDTLNSQLVPLSTGNGEASVSNEETKVELHFWCDMEKIAPLYGSKTFEFARLEAGYMIGAMNRELAHASSALRVAHCAPAFEWQPFLSAEEATVGSANLSLQKRDEFPTICVFKRDNADQFWHTNDGQARLLSSTYTEGEKGIFDEQSIFFHANAGLLHSASVIIALSSPQGHIHTASLAQSLLEEAAPHKLGFTTIPYISDRFESFFAKRGLDAPKVILVGGLLPDASLLSETAQSISPLKRMNQHLSKRLPSYMLLNKLLTLDQLPLTANGKVDRKKLMTHVEEHVASVSEHVAADLSSDMELLIAEIWADVLSLDKQSLNTGSSFFDLGGHSLSAIKVQGFLKTALSFPDIPLKAIFSNPHLGDLATELERLGGKANLDGSGSSALLRDCAAVADEVRTEEEWKDARFEPFPLTPIQQAYLIGRDPLVELGGVATHAYQEFAVPSWLTPDLLGSVISTLVDRHNALRIVFEQNEETGLFQQRVLPIEETGEYQVLSVDLLHEEPEVGEHITQSVRAELSHQVLDPAVWPLFDVRMTKTKEANVLHISLDALIVDFYSSAILAADALRLIEAGRQGSFPKLAPPRTTFRELVLTELDNREKDGAGMARSLSYWQDRAATFPLAPELPLSKRPSQVQVSLFEREEAIVSRENVSSLETFARRHNILPTTVLAHAFAQALSMYTTDSRFVVNLTVFQRPLEIIDADQVVGDFTSSLLLEYDGEATEEEASVRHGLERLNTQLINDLSHASFSGVDMIRHLRRRNGASRQVAFPVVMTSVLNDIGASNDMSKLMDLLGRPRHSISQTPQVFLDFQAIKGSDGALTLRWDYLVELFPPGMIHNMHAFFAGAVNDMCSEQGWREDFKHPCRFHKHVPWDIGARTALNATLDESLRGQDQLLHTGFLRSTLMTPNAKAVYDAADDVTLSYIELARCVNSIGQEMQDSWTPGAAENEAVAVILPKGWRQIAAVYAVLCSGKAYIPIEADSPAQRIALILEQAGCNKAIVSNRQIVADLGFEEKGVQSIALDRLELASSHVESSSPADLVQRLNLATVNPSHKAYIIFTSGSTGVPKGVVISHGAAFNTIADVINKWSLSSRDVAIGISKLSFDLSVFDAFGPLSVGGSLVLPPADCKDPELWASLVAEHGVTVWNSVPMIVQMLLEAPTGAVAQAWKSLKLILMSGDWIPISLARKLLSLDEGAETSTAIVSLGGATEASIWSIYHTITPEDVGEDAKSIPYGRPLANQQMHIAVIDANGRWIVDDAPTFAVGDLFISGQGLANGYTDPIKTAQAFIRHPSTGQRLYRTGDLARYLGNGEIEFFGRSDFQVKIRGHRIELDEIQYHLERLAGVAGASAFVVSDSIVAALVKDQGDVNVSEGADFSIEQINQELGLALPKYMLIDHVFTLDSLPLSPNGKVDRKALSAQAEISLSSRLGGRKTSAAGRTPSTPAELALSSIWSEILDDDKGEVIDTASCFFELGGHSLLAIRLKGAIEKHLEVLVPLKELYKQPCRLGELAEVIDKLAVEQREAGAVRDDDDASLSEVPSASDLDRYAPFELTPIQAAYLLGRGDQMELGNVSAHSYVEYRLPSAFVHRHGSLSVAETVGKIIDRLVQRHDALRLTFDLASQTQRVLRAEDVGPYAVRSLDLSNETDTQFIQATIGQTRDEMEALVMDAAAWPLFDISVTVLPQDEVILHVSLDMLIMDFASSAILAQEFVQLASSLDTSTALPSESQETEVSTFKDHVLADRRFRKSKRFTEMAQYWKSRSADFPAGPDLSRNASVGTMVAPTFDRREAVISKGDFEKLKRTASTLKVNLGSVLASAFAKVLFRYVSLPHFAINLTLFSRPADAQEHNVVGDFTSSLLLEFDERKSHPDFLTEVRKTEERLIQDVENSRFSGVECIRLLNSERNEKTMYPVVMTMVLHDTAFDQEVIDMFGEPVYAITQTPQVDLDFQCVRSVNGDLVLRIDYLKDMFAAAYIEDIHQSLHSFVATLCDAEDAAWSSTQDHLPVEVASLQQPLRAAFNETTRTFEHDDKVSLLHEGFLRQVQRSPASIAVADVQGALCYEELAILVADLQSKIRRLNISSQERVAVVLPKSRHQVAACLAILSLGCAYVPIDEGAPVSRIQTIITEANCCAAIVQGASAATDIPQDICHFIGLETQVIAASTMTVQQATQQLLQTEQDTTISPQDEAYLIFTSGSTGKPKGVIIQHYAAANTINDLVARWQLTAEDTFLGLAKLSFDLSVFDIFASLTVGGTLVLPASLMDGEVHDPQAWLSLISEHSVTVWNSVPMMAQMLLSTRVARLRKQLASLRIMLLSGDRFPVELAKGLLDVCSPDMALYSGGGATEASIWSVLHRVEPQDFENTDGTAALIPYGRPMDNQTMYVLQQPDESRTAWRHAPTYAPAKLFIGGVGLAKGYTDEEKTRATFVSVPGLGRLYDTGDVVRFLPSGELEFLGRRDLQVKIRGHRIELEEINHRLKQVCGVEDSVVKVIDGQLVGFAVPVNEMPSVNPYEGFALLEDNLERLTLKADLADDPDSILEAVRPVSAYQAPIPISRTQETIDLVQTRRSHYDFMPEPPTVELVAAAHARAHQMASSIFSLGYQGLNDIPTLPLTLDSVLCTVSGLVGDVKESGSYKYRYPSAGATYSVRVVLRLHNVDGAQDGLYVFDPKAGSLVLVSTTKPSRLELQDKSYVDFFFLSYLPAVAPLYGDATTQFVGFEKGYMLGAMADLASQQKLRFHIEGLGSTSRSAYEQIVSQLGLDTTKYLSLGGAVLTKTPESSQQGQSHFAVSLELSGRATDRSRAFDLSASDSAICSAWTEVKRDWKLSDQPLAFHHNAALLRKATSVVTVASEGGPVMSAIFAQLFAEAGQASSPAPSLGWTQSPWICNAWSRSFESCFGRKPHITLVGGVVPTATESSTEPSQDPLDITNKELSASLPSYMLLSSLVPLFDGLPLSCNGKVDHAKLIELSNAHVALQATHYDADGQYPTTSQELLIAGAMAEALGVPVASVALNASFFKLGGNSLSSIKLQGLLRQRLNVDLDLKSIFLHPSINGIKAAISKMHRSDETAPKADDTLALSVMANLEGPEHQEEPFPLTAIQEAYLLGRNSAFALGNIATHAYLEFEAPSSTSAEVLTTLLRALVNKHDAMRLVFDFDTQMQRVIPVDQLPDWEVEYVDLTEESDQVAQLTRDSIRKEMSHQMLPADQWPLFDIRASRASTCASSKTDSRGAPLILHVSLDMLIMDFFSSAILADDLVEAFQQLKQGKQVELAQPPITFRQFVVSEHKRRENGVANVDRDYWLSRASTFPLSGPDLPLVKRMDRVQKPRFRKIESILPKRKMAALEAKAAAAGVTASAAIATAFGRVLARYSESTTNFGINLTVFSRPVEYTGIDQIMGDFTKSILLNYDDGQNKAAQDSFSVRASGLNLQLLEDVGHASGFSGIEFARHLRSKTGQDVVYPVVMTCVLSDFGASHTLGDIEDLLGHVTYSVSQTPQVSIDFQCVRKANGDLSVRWDYLEELFYDGFITEAHAGLVDMLEHLASEDTAWFSKLSPNIDLVQNENVCKRLAANEDQVTHSFGSSKTGRGLTAGNTCESLLHTGFLRILRSSPHQRCITDAQGSITYAHIGSAISHVISELKKVGVVPGDRVAVLMPKCWQQAAACLAILSHSCSYVPIESTQPRARIEMIVAEAQCTAVLTVANDHERLSYLQLPKIAVVAEGFSCIETSKRLADRLLRSADSIDADREAYVIFTSGSTGRPKGVRMSHAGAMNTINDLITRWNLGAEDVFFGLASQSFDLSVFDLFASMSVGAHLVLPSGSVDASEWATLVRTHRVSVWNSVPMHLQMVVATLAEDDLAHVKTFDGSYLESVRVCLLSGDKLPVDLAQTLKRNVPHVDVYSGGGATEAGIWSIMFPISRELADDATFVPYGRAMRNQTFHVLNSRLEPCPTFVAGELFIGGDSLALGYIDTSQTERAFLDIDVDGTGVQRLYRTADFGRFLASGDIQILGRKDDQIKIRGHRIELGEIETRILDIASVNEAAVVVSRGAEAADVSLHAFVTAIRDAPSDATAPRSVAELLSEAQIRSHLEITLPRYMVPSSISIVDKLQISTNGKVDRKTLESKVGKTQEINAANKANIAEEVKIVSPSNNLERSIRAIWAQLLKVEPDTVGCDQDFFGLGGNSLSAVRVLTTIKRTFGVKLDMVTILREPTVQSIALHMVKAGISADAPEIEPSASTGSTWPSLFSRA